MVARRAHNPKVVGSNPIPASNKMGYRQAVKTQDFDSCISLVQIQLSQPYMLVWLNGRAADL